MPGGKPFRYSLIQYSFKSGIEQPIQPKRHGNSKKESTSKPYIRTWASTKESVRNASEILQPRDAVHKVILEDLGGIAKCSSVGQIPRGRQQVKDLGKRAKGEGPKKTLSSGNEKDDPWYRLLGDCKKQAVNRKTAFIRDVRIAPEPLCIMTTDRQLHDLKRFCCNPVEFRPFTVDPTFDIGKYNITPITYQHLLLENKRDGKHPSFIGPVLLHEKKTTETYSIFSGTLKTLQPELRDVMAFGTDDERALIEGFRNNFERSVHLLCELHLKKNIESKLQKFAMIEQVKRKVISDIFGETVETIHISGLIDAQNEQQFQDMLENLKEKWSILHDEGEAFHAWFCNIKAQEFLTSAIQSVRERAGLGCPPERFTTNRSEQTNRVIQEFVRKECNGKKNIDEFSFCASLAKLVNMQNQEIELAVVGSGEYRLREKFKSLEVTPEKWAKMREDQRKKVLEKVHNVELHQSSASFVENITKFLGTCAEPIVNELINAGVDWIPRELLSTMVSKAIPLANEGGQVIAQGNDTYIVPSHSNARKPHIVNVYPNGKIECDDNCPGFSSRKICKHTVAVSLKLKRMDQHIRWFVSSQRRTGGINYSKAITHGMPKGRGKKGNTAPRKRSRKVGATVTTVIPRVLEAISQHTESSQPSNFPEFQRPQTTAPSTASNTRFQYPMLVEQMQSNVLLSFQQPTESSQTSGLPEFERPQNTTPSTVPNTRFQYLTSVEQMRSNVLPALQQLTGSSQTSTLPQFQRPQTTAPSTAPNIINQFSTSSLPLRTGSSQTSGLPPTAPNVLPSLPNPYLSELSMQPNNTTTFIRNSFGQQLTSPSISGVSQIRMCSPNQLPQQRVAFPNPDHLQFLIYLVQFCPAQTSMCFGCGNPLRQLPEAVPAPPDDLVVVSKMLREWTYQGQARSKLGNVYFHCNLACVKRKARDFNANQLSPISPELQPHLQLIHRRHLREHFGV